MNIAAVTTTQMFHAVSFRFESGQEFQSGCDLVDNLSLGV
jgi:hypothetical protein